MIHTPTLSNQKIPPTRPRFSSPWVATLNTHFLATSMALLVLAACIRTPALGAPGTVVEWGSTTGVQPGTTGIVKIAAGYTHLLALSSTGQVQGWGGDLQNRLPINDSFDGGAVTDIATGDMKSAALWSTGRVTWSASSFTLANWTTATAIAMRGFQTVARLSDGTVAVDGGTAPPAGLTGVTAVAAGRSHALALKSDGTVVAWGNNLYGQRDVPAGLDSVTAVAAGEYHSLALKSDGTVVAWGAGASVAVSPDDGQSMVPAGLTGVTAIAAGHYHSAALKNDGSVVCWGNNEASQCTVPATVRNVQQISAGGYFTAAIMLPEPDITVGIDNQVARGGFRHEFFANPGGTVSRTVFVSNWGTAPLTGLAATVDGPDAAKFALSPLAVTSLPPGQFTTLTVTFQPDTARAYLAELHLVSNDPDESPVDYLLSGRTPMGTTLLRGGSAAYFLDRIPVAAGDVTAVDAEGTYSAIVRSDGSLTSWGGDMDGAAGVFTLAPPADWPGVRDIAICSSALPSAVLITRDGALWTWAPLGAQLYSQLLPASAAVRKIACGGLHYLAIKGDATLYANGTFNTYGEATPPAGLWPVQDIAAGADFSLALLGDGSVHAWGRNHLGQTNVPPGLVAVDVAAGYNHVLALRPDGTVTGWGSNDHGQLNIPAGLNQVIAVEASGDSSAAIRRDGSIVFWGLNSATSPPLMPRPAALAMGGQVIALTAPQPEIALTQAGRDIADGFGFDFDWSTVGVPVAKTFTVSNSGGAAAILSLTKIGAHQGDYTVSGFPSSLAPGASADFTVTFTPAAAGVRLATLRIGSNDLDENPFDIPVSGRTPMHVSAWGMRSAATQVPQGLNDAVAVAAGSFHSLALRSNGTVVAWGGNEFGETQVPPGLTNVKAIAAGAGFSLALRTDGTVVHWGIYSGYLPTGLTGVKAVSAGFSHALALKTDGTLVAWGVQVAGEVSDVNGLPGIFAFAAGRWFSIGQGQTEGLPAASFGAGRNQYGQASVPPFDGIALAAGAEHAAMLLRDGTVVGWGRNQAGQATPPAGLTGVRAIEAGQDFVVALKNDGTLAAWGGSGSASLAPTGYGPVGGVAAGDNHVLALTGAFPNLAVFGPSGHPSTSGFSGIQLGSAGLAGSEPQVWTIMNQGAATLTGLAISLTGADAAHFLVTQPPVTTLAPGDSTSFSLRFVPTTPGLRQAGFQIASNDPDENPFTVWGYGSTDFTPIQAWRYSWFGVSDNIDPYGNAFDFDGDGVLNMMECAFGTNPLFAAGTLSSLRYSGPASGGGTLVARGQPIVLYEKDGATTTIRGLWIRRKDHVAAGIVYTPEFAANPGTFTASTATPQVLATDGYYDVVAVTFPATVPGGVPRFFRVGVSIPNPD